MPDKGRHIWRQDCEYFKAPDGLPAIRFHWEGRLFGYQEAVFVFARDSLEVARVSDSIAARSVKESAGFGKPIVYGALVGGILGSLVASALGSATANTSGVKAFAVTYLNEKERRGYFIATASPEIVDEILASVPQDRTRPDDHMMR